MYDLTLPIRPQHPPWPGDMPFSRTQAMSTERGDPCNVSHIQMSVHFGTHLDAPFHFEPDGLTLEHLSLGTLMGPALVHETDAAPLITAAHLPPLDGVERIIFKTANTRRIGDTGFHSDYIALGLDAAQALVRAGVKLAGIDYFSIEAYKSPGHPVHHELCGNGVIIVEGLDLRAVQPGWYDLTCLPLKIEGSDGCPCRAVLKELK